MSDIQVVTQTQVIEVEPATSSVSIINAGPPGPPGSVDLAPVIEEIDTKIATHNQATPVHPGATSGRDFSALFQNGLV